MVTSSGTIHRIRINAPDPIMAFGLRNEQVERSPAIFLSRHGIKINTESGRIVFIEKLGDESHIFGLGLKALSMDRKRNRTACVNVDPGGYVRFKDPLCLNIPFYVHVDGSSIHALFFNSPARVEFDFGVSIYDSVMVHIPAEDLEIFLIGGGSFEEISKQWASLSGLPCLPPSWSFGHIISRVTYLPSSRVLSVVDRYLKEFPLDAICLDIHYMETFHIFTWNSDAFPDPEGMIRALHEKGVRVITNVSPSIKADQNFKLFREGIGSYIETENGEIFTGEMWPGKSAFLDYFRNNARNLWKHWIKDWISQGIDGIWLDMNEPTVITGDHLFPPSLVHNLDGRLIRHSDARNAYSLFQAMSTHEAFREAGKEPFVLSRSGFAGIQKYAMVWTGDSTASYDDLTLQISMVVNLGISGIPFCGCDLGGFLGRSSPDLIDRYYRTALFFPFYRNHKNSDGNDQELYILPDSYKQKIRKSLDLRYQFLPTILDLADGSSKTGLPLVMGLFQEFMNDRTAYYLDDEYLLGKNILYAPQVEKDKESRQVYLPEGIWYEFFSGHRIDGKCYVNTIETHPIYIRDNSITRLSWGLFIAGTGHFEYGMEREQKIKFSGNVLRSSYEFHCERLVFCGFRFSRAVSSGREFRPINNGELQVLEISSFREIMFFS